uniref:Uncharacterized protein n=1 Tax=Lepeophtheirus salmonis TaxID=72036 RepID=A0A0K2ULN1_LEPSM
MTLFGRRRQRGGSVEAKEPSGRVEGVTYVFDVGCAFEHDGELSPTRG